jgi:hypothetical protein
VINLLENIQILHKIEDDFGITFRGQKFDPDPWSSNFGENDYFYDVEFRYGTLKHQNEYHVLTLKCQGNEISYLFKMNWDPDLKKFKDTFKGRVKDFYELYVIIKNMKRGLFI